MTELRKRGRRRSQNGVVAVMVTLILLILLSTVVLFLPSKDDKKKEAGKTPIPTVTPAGEKMPVQEEELLAVVLETDTEIKMITVYDVKKEEQRKIVYIGATTFFDGYGVQMTAAQLEAGALYRFIIDTKEEWIVTATEAVDRRENVAEGGVWEKNGVTYISINQNSISFRNQNYRYSEGICVMNNGKTSSLSELKPGVDVLTVRGQGQVIYEIVVTKGHGYITLKNHEDFIDGTITIGSTRMDTITEEATYLVREGTYSVTVDSGEYKGTEQITVARDTTAVFDVFDYGSGPIKKGWLTISVDPLGATLYVDGVKTYYTDGLELEYGTYQFEFSEGGYISYKATVQIDQPRQSISAFLIEQEAAPTVAPDDPTENTSGNSAGENNSDTSGENDTSSGNDAAGGNTPAYSQTSVSITHMKQYELELDNAIYILGPEGAEIYLDGTYLGKAPIDFEKIIGVYKIKVVRADGREKEYSVAETDNGEDSYYNFGE